MRTINSNKGFTLIEMIVSASILILVVVAASQMYVTASSAQRRAYGKQNALDSTRYALEYMGRAIRQGTLPPNAFSVSNQIHLYHYDSTKCGSVGTPCSVYFRRTSAGAIQEAIVAKDTAASNFQNITGFAATANDTTNVVVESIRFTGSAQDSGVHPRVTIAMVVRPDLPRSTEESRVKIQTTITSRDPRWLSTQ